MNIRCAVITLLLAALLMASAPAFAQDTARVRFVNLAIGSDEVHFFDHEANPLISVGPYGSMTDFVDVDADLILGLGALITRGDVSSGSALGGAAPVFTGGHEYVVVFLDDAEDSEFVYIDLTTSFGGSESVADDGLGRLILIYYVRNVAAGAYSLWNADGVSLGSYFYAPDFSDALYLDVQTLTLGLPPGDYTHSATPANDKNNFLLSAQTFSLRADQITLVGLIGSYPDAVQGVIISPDGVMVLSE